MPDRNPSIDELFNLRASFPTDDERRDFFSAARNNDISRLEKIVQKWPEAPEKWRDTQGHPVLMSAYNCINSNTIDFLVKKGANIAQGDREGSYNALIYAAFLGTAQDVEKFVRAGGDPNSRDTSGHTALHLAVKYNPKPEIVDLLVVCGADPNAKDKWGNTPLKECKNEETRDVILAARARRETFLKNYQSKAAETASSAPAAEESDEIKLLKRIELRKGGEEPATAAPAGKQSWWKRTFG